MTTPVRNPSFHNVQMLCQQLGMNQEELEALKANTARAIQNGKEWAKKSGATEVLKAHEAFMDRLPELQGDNNDESS